MDYNLDYVYTLYIHHEKFDIVHGIPGSLLINQNSLSQDSISKSIYKRMIIYPQIKGSRVCICSYPGIELGF